MANRTKSEKSTARAPSRRSDITLEQIEAFCAVAEATSYRQAAHDLPSGKPFDSSHLWLIRRIDRLEKHLGKKLVEGTPRGDVTLTSIGHQLLPVARAMRDAAHALKHANPALRLSAYPAIAARLLMHEDARQLFEGDPALTLYDVTERHRGDRGQSILNCTALGEIDLGIAPSGSKRTDLAIELAKTPLYDWTMQIVLPRDADEALHERKRIRVGEIADMNIVCAPEGHRSRELLDGLRGRGPEAQALRRTLEPGCPATTRSASHIGRRDPPNDAFGAPTRLGPDLASRKQTRYGDSYSLYHRRPFNSGDLTDREQLIREFADRIIDAFSGQSRDFSQASWQSALGSTGQRLPEAQHRQHHGVGVPLVRWITAG